jgi:hypothetical protein
MIHFHIVTWRLKAGVVEPEQTTTAVQRLGKHIPSATNMQETIEQLPFLRDGDVNTSL